MSLGTRFERLIKDLQNKRALNYGELRDMSRDLDRLERNDKNGKPLWDQHSLRRDNPHLVDVAGLHNGLNDGGNLLGVNLIKNYPSLEGADGSAPLWWTSALATITEEDATGESLNGTQPNERIIKCVTTGAGGVIYQNFTTTNERLLVASETVVSFGAWVYIVTAGTLLVYLNDSVDGVIESKSITETGKWIFVSLENVTIGDNTLAIAFNHNQNAATFYVANPVLNVGSSVISWKPRGLVYRHYEGGGYIVTNFDPAGTAWTEHDLTSLTSNNAVMAELSGIYRNQTTAFSQLNTRQGSSSSGHVVGNSIIRAWVAGDYYFNTFVQLLDDRQVFDYGTNRPAGDTEGVWFSLRGYWEWE